MIIKRYASLALLCLYGCGNADTGGSQEPTNASPEAQPAVTTSDAMLSAAEIQKKGQILFMGCRACHTVDVDGAHQVGPNLNGLMGAVAGKKEGYQYSDALAGSGIVWTEDTLDQWLENAGGLVEGNRMIFAGIPAAADRATLIAYLKDATQ